MTGIIDWATSHARMVMVFVVLSLVAGANAYITLPKEGEPDIDIPGLFVSVPFPGISAADSEKLLVKPMESRLKELDGLDQMSASAGEGYAGIFLEFEFGWDKEATIANVRDKMNQAEGDFPDGAEQYTINEINFSQFPILVVSLAGDIPERTLTRVAKDLQDVVEAMPAVLEAGLVGQRNEMVEVLIDPLKLEAYNVTAGDLIDAVNNNNLLIAAGEIESDQGTFAVKIPSSFDEQQDVYDLPIKVNGDRVITFGDVAEIRLTFEDRTSTARYNSENTIALQVVKRKGFNLIDTVDEVKALVESERALWPAELQDAIKVNFTSDQSRQVKDMVSQLEGSVLTAIMLVMIVVLAALGVRSALLVGFAIPTSFFLAFLVMGATGITISNIVMFGLILAVGMLVDGAIVVVEYADKRIAEGTGPMQAYGMAAKRMFWPIVSSTATTLCAFLPMLFWPGIPGEFMGMLPVTLIYVLSASLLVALVYLPVVGGVIGRFVRWIDEMSDRLSAQGKAGAFPLWIWNILVLLGSIALIPISISLITFLFSIIGMLFTWMNGLGSEASTLSWLILRVVPVMILTGILLGACLLLLAAIVASIVGIIVSIVAFVKRFKRFMSPYLEALHRAWIEIRTMLGFPPVERQDVYTSIIERIVLNPKGPIFVLLSVFVFCGTVFTYFGQNNHGTEFFVETDPETAIVYVRARGNLSLAEKDELVKQVEALIQDVDGIESAFSFAGDGGLNNNTGGAAAPLDTVGQVQLATDPWEDRKFGPTGKSILAEVERRVAGIPGMDAEILNLDIGPATGKPVFLRISGERFEDMQEAVDILMDRFRSDKELVKIEDTTPLPGIDWEIDVDVEKAGRYDASVAGVGAMVQLVTRGLLLGDMRQETSDEEIDIRVRFPESDRTLATLETLRIRTESGLVPISNFIETAPVEKLGLISRVDSKRVYDVKADVAEGVNANAKVAELTEWLENEAPLPDTIEWAWVGDQEDQEESAEFLSGAGIAALALMFIILLAQFNSFYNSVLVLFAVILSVTGVLIGMLVWQQPFSIIMTGTGIVALAGIVVNNNIVLIDTYQEYCGRMDPLEAIIKTCQARIRPVILTTITTIAGLTPMMLGISIDFWNGGYTIDQPTALWWKQLATAVIFGLGLATLLTLVLTPSLLAMRIWISRGAYNGITRLFKRDKTPKRKQKNRVATAKV